MVAGQGYKDFAVGEVLTSSDVDGYLMEQAVMRFASDAARGSALGTAVGAGTALAEGMVAYLDDLNDVQVFNGAAWKSVGAAGIGSNVQQAIQTAVFTTTSTSFLNVTGLQVTITPSSATSKILLLSLTNWSSGDSTNRNCLVRIAGGNAGDFRGDASGTSQRAAAMGGSRISIAAGWSPTEHVFPVSLVYLDSPATASAVTYDVQVRVSSGTFRLNRSDDDLDRSGRQASSLVAIEVAG